MNKNVTQEIFQHYYLNHNGDEMFGGNFIIGTDPADLENKLNGTTSIINLIFPFADMVNPIVEPWIKKQERRKGKNQDTFSIFDEETVYGQALKCIPPIQRITRELSEETINDGNYSEVVTLHLLQNNGDISNLEDTIYKEEKENKTKLFKSERAINFGKIAYKEIMKLGNDVKLIDYQVVASEKDLHDVGFFDFVVEADEQIFLIDMKTGSRVKDSKLEKVKFQLLGSYKYKFAGIYGKYPDKIVVISAVEDEVKVGSNKIWSTFGEIIDITNEDPNNHYREIYQEIAKLYHRLFLTKIWKKNKQENKVVL